MRKPVLAIVASLLLFCGAAHAGVTVRPVVWVLALDDSASTTDFEFTMYAQMLRRAALERTRGNDIVILMRLATLQVDSVTLDGHFTRQRQQVEELYKKILAMPKRKQGGFTDFQRVLEHVRERMRIEQQTGRRDLRYVLVFASDGKPDPDRRRKASPPGDASYLADWRMLHVGIRPENEAALRAACREAGFVDESRTLVLSFGQWGSVDATLTRFIERQPDAALQRLLEKAGPSSPLKLRRSGSSSGEFS